MQHGGHPARLHQQADRDHHHANQRGRPGAVRATLHAPVVRVETDAAVAENDRGLVGALTCPVASVSIVAMHASCLREGRAAAIPSHDGILRRNGRRGTVRTYRWRGAHRQA